MCLTLQCLNTTTDKQEMRKIIELDTQVAARLAEGKYVEGSLHRDQHTGSLVFRSYHRSPRHRSDERLVCQLEHGWMKESARRIKFYSSVRKSLGWRLIDLAMHRELKHAMGVLEVENIMDNV